MEENELMLSAFYKVKEVILKEQSITSAMNEIIDFCKTNYAHNDWAKFSELDYNDTSEMEQWFNLVIETEPVPEEIDGLWIGLFNPVLKNGNTTADLYIAGNSGFDIDDEEGEWAVDPIYFPESRYSNSGLLGEIYTMAYNSGKGLGNIAEYILCLAYACFLTKTLMIQYGNKIFQQKSHPVSKEIGVSVGFDSGDSLSIGKVTKDGFLNL
jgi:hypothetical protein